MTKAKEIVFKEGGLFLRYQYTRKIPFIIVIKRRLRAVLQISFYPPY